jgi:hypothetical protein
MRDTGPHTEWYPIDLPVGTVLHDGFGDEVRVVEVPDELWEQYQSVKKEVEAIVEPEEPDPAPIPLTVDEELKETVHRGWEL